MYYVEYLSRSGYCRQREEPYWELYDACFEAKNLVVEFNEDMARVVDDEGHVYYSVEWGIIEEYGTPEV